MMTLYSLMGERRQAKIREILEHWKAHRMAPRSSKGNRLPAICHPDKLRTGNLLCRACWMRDYRKRTGKNGSYYRKRQQFIAEAV